MSDLLTAALAAAGHGWPVFMLGRSKRPLANCPACPRGAANHDPETCDHLTCHGFYAATRDPDRIRSIIAAAPHGQLAVRTGAASGLVVPDIDPAHGGMRTLHTLISDGVLTPTRRVLTGSGGLHLYYRHPGGHIPSSQGRPGIGLGPGVDVRADGGYAVLPPSIHPATGRRYAWADDGREVVEMTPPLIGLCLRTPPTPPRASAGCRIADTQPFRVLLTGSRTWTDTEGITAVLDRLLLHHGAALTVVHGACPTGADAIAEAWCDRNHVPVERHPADWSSGRRAGPTRNAAMVAAGPDLCLAFIRDASPGATGCARLAEHAGIRTLRSPRPNDLSTPPQALASGRSRNNGGVISAPDRLLNALLDRLANAAEGHRRTTLYGISRGVARIVAAGHLTARQAVDILTTAGRDADQTDRDIDNAISDAFHAEGVPL